MEMTKETKYLRFVDWGNPGKRTKHISVENPKSQAGLGSIRWYGPWRQYAFEPYMSTVYDNECLRDIALVLDELNEGQKEQRDKGA